MSGIFKILCLEYSKAHYWRRSCALPAATEFTERVKCCLRFECCVSEQR